MLILSTKLYTTILSNCKAKKPTNTLPAMDRLPHCENLPCNIYFAFLTLTITLNIQNPPVIQFFKLYMAMDAVSTFFFRDLSS